MLHTYTSFDTTTNHETIQELEHKANQKLEQIVKSGKMWSAVLPAQPLEEHVHGKIEHTEVVHEVYVQNVYGEVYIKDSILFSGQRQASLISFLLELNRLFREDHFQWQLTLTLRDWNASTTREILELLELFTLLKAHTHAHFVIAWNPSSVNEDLDVAIEALLHMMETIYTSIYFSICNISFRIPFSITNSAHVNTETFFQTLQQFSNLKIQVPSSICSWRHPLYNTMATLSKVISITASNDITTSIMTNPLQLGYQIIDKKFDTVALYGAVHFSQ